MSKLVIAALAAMSVGACATSGNVSGGSANARVTAQAGKQYCWESRLASAGGRHNFNWTSNKQAACEGDAPFTIIDGARYTAPRTSPQCSNGRWLVEMAPLG